MLTLLHLQLILKLKMNIINGITNIIKNVLRNGYLCYEIIANWDEKNNDYNMKSFRYYGTDKLYIDMETYKFIEIEKTFYIDDEKIYIVISMNAQMII